MVWIHGGGNTVGAGSQPRVDGTHLAHIGDVVVVTLNYRLGALGFLYSPELGSTGNEALLDQCLAMRWVRSEIAAFGGDPKNVTVFGQSAGGFDIAQLMAMEDAHGCFDKMVPMSGSLSPQVLPEAAHRTASALADHFGGFDKLRGIPASEVHAHQSRIPGARWGPTRDGQIIARDAGDALGSGEFTKTMPLLIGHTRDESTLFTALNPQMASMDQSQLLSLMNSTFGERGKEAADCYEESRQRAGLRCNPIDIWAAVSTDRMFRMPAIRTAELHQSHTEKTWMYRFDHESPAHNGALQATHSLDIPFVWGTYGLPQMERFCGTSGVAELSRCVMASYLEFARHGNPSNDLVPDWPQYEPTKRSTMLFGNDVGIADAPLDETRNWLVSQS